jgi:hypothetical protein
VRKKFQRISIIEGKERFGDSPFVPKENRVILLIPDGSKEDSSRSERGK